jgi:hypothetical protein
VLLGTTAGDGDGDRNGRGGCEHVEQGDGGRQGSEAGT